MSARSSPSTGRLAEVEKFLDTVAICPGQLGQIGALWGMRNLTQWVAGERAEILARRAAMVRWFQRVRRLAPAGLRGLFRLCRTPLCRGVRCGVQTAGDGGLPADAARHDVPATEAAEGKRQIRIAFANVDAAGIAEMFTRLSKVSL